jgi:hypothetical protein
MAHRQDCRLCAASFVTGWRHDDGVKVGRDRGGKTIDCYDMLVEFPIEWAAGAAGVVDGAVPGTA